MNLDDILGDSDELLDLPPIQSIPNQPAQVSQGPELDENDDDPLTKELDYDELTLVYNDKHEKQIKASWIVLTLVKGEIGRGSFCKV